MLQAKSVRVLIKYQYSYHTHAIVWALDSSPHQSYHNRFIGLGTQSTNRNGRINVNYKFIMAKIVQWPSHLEFITILTFDSQFHA